MGRHRRSGWGDIDVDSAGYMNGVLYSKRKTGYVHTSKAKKKLSFSWIRTVGRVLLLPLVLLLQLVQTVFNGLIVRKKTPARVRLATKELKKPTKLRQTEHVTVRMSLGKPANLRAVAAVAGGRVRRDSRTKEIFFGAACFVLCILSAAVAPALAAPPEGSTVFTFCDNGRVISAVSSAATVQDFLKENGVDLSAGDEINVQKDASLQNGMLVSIDRALPVTVVSGGRRLAAGIQSGTVADALMSAGVKVDENDRISPSLDTKVRAGMTIEHTVVETAYISQTEIVPYKTVYKETSSLYKGKEKIEQYGVNGKISHKIRINYEDGEEISRYEIESNLIRESTNEVVLVGTRVAYSGSSRSSSGSSSSSSSSSSSGSSGGSTSSGVISPSKIRTTLRMSTTAYTFTGHRTATGTYPHHGTVAVNPSVIPYGTRLYIEGYGYGVAEDTGSFIYSYPNRIDLFMESLSQCYSWGRRTVNVYILK